jgi:hypothetical protein
MLYNNLYLHSKIIVQPPNWESFPFGHLKIGLQSPNGKSFLVEPLGSWISCNGSTAGGKAIGGEPLGL